jgi:hypothetical protein
MAKAAPIHATRHWGAEPPTEPAHSSFSRVVAAGSADAEITDDRHERTPRLLLAGVGIGL